MDQKIVILLLARGGSKTIPRKNVEKLNGHPLIFYALRESKKSIVNNNNIWVSTDDEEIKRLSLSYGVNVLGRPSELATDESPSENSLLHFADNVDFDILIFIQPTSPLITFKDINRGIDKILNEDYDSLFSVALANDILMWDINRMIPVNYNLVDRKRKQTREYFGIETGAFYITKKEALLKSKCRLSGKIGYVQIPYWRSFQIDDYDDLEGIEKLMRE